MPDITELKRVERALVASEQRWRSLFNEMPIATMVFQKRSDDFILVDCNEAMLQLTARAIADHIGDTARHLYGLDRGVLVAMDLCYEEKTAHPL